MSNKSGTSSQVISLPQGGGALHGIGETFSPDLFTGTGNFSVPIALPPGRNGFQPTLNLIYSTGNGNGPFGLGWGLSVPGVSRKTSKGVPRYRDAEDVFILSGAEDLVPVSGEFPGEVQYRPRTEGLFAKITYHRDSNNSYWEVRSKDGLVSLYGTPGAVGSDPAVVADPANRTKVFAWNLTRTLDTFGNKIEYEYERDTGEEGPHHWDQLYLKRIRFVDYNDETTGEERFLVSVTFDYDDEERPDPFSEYRAGFEIRTRKRCKQIVIRTHADAERLVRTYTLVYLDERIAAGELSETVLPRNGVSILSQMKIIGHDGDQTEELPPLEFGYTQFEPEGRDFFPLNGKDLPAQSLASPDLALADLFGNGLPDIFQMNGTVRYWRNLGNGTFDLPREMRDAPAGLQLSDPGVQLIDANGDGRIDLLVTSEPLAGYFPTRPGGLWDRRSFQRYRRAPSFDLEDAEVQLVDLDGDGVTDAIRSGSRLECFFNDPLEGWNGTRFVERRDIEEFPNVNFSDPRVKWGDMSGDGLQDIVLVYDGNIEYWPNLGYGDWGKRVSMRNSPSFPYGYDPKHILLGDVDGDGLDDIVYVDHGKVMLWINQSGNRWSDPIEIDGTPPVTDMDAVRLVDLLGTGIGGVLWSAEATAAGRPHMFFLDFTGGVKPYIMHEMNNHMGALTRVEYAPSTRFYLEDQQRPEMRWQTTLPFPVQVVARVEVIDEISRGKLTTEYRYHHGYWDGAEREFRGFGRVDQRDTEVFEDYHATGLHPERPFDPVPNQSFSPPTETRTWFHQGPIGEEFGEWYEADYRNEYWPDDPEMLARPAEFVAFLNDANIPRRVKRDAIRALRGRILRTELYALDGTDREDRPYTVTEHLYGVCGVVDEGDHSRLACRSDELPSDWQTDDAAQRIFFPHVLAQRTTQHERGEDPMTQLAFTDDYDTYGQPRSQIAVAVPRGRDYRLAAAPGEPYLATHTVMTYAQRDDAERYIVDRVARASSYEILNDGSPSVFQLRESILDNTASRSLFNQTRSYYDGSAFEGLPLGQIGDHGALVRTESLVLTEEILHEAYKSGSTVLTPPEAPAYLNPSETVSWTADYPDEFRARMPPLAGYTFYPGGPDPIDARGYFVQAERRRYDFHDSPPGQGRGLVRITRDPLGRDTTIDYDAFDLLPTQVTDPVGLSTAATHDYRVLQPREVTDSNGNRMALEFTPLGLVASTAIMGKAGENIGDTPEAPGTRFVYDLLAFADPARRQPISVKTIKHVHHVHDTDVPLPERDETIEAVEYSDGFGRLLQTRTQAEDVTFGDPVFGGAVLPADQSVTPGDAVGRQRAPEDPPNVVVSGWQIYDNKGQVVEKFEPFFSSGYAYASPTTVQLGQKVTMFYDPRGQVIRTVNPDGSEQRVVFGVPGTIAVPDLTDPDLFEPTAWEAYTYDANDNAERTHGSGDPTHWNTPTSIEIDALGRRIKTVERNGPNPSADWFITRSTYDIRGNPLTVTDALGRLAFEYTYDLADQSLRIENIDAGVHRIVLDATGSGVERRDSKGALMLQAYDVLNRPIRLWARDDAGSAVTLREHLLYGDSADAGLTETEARAANLLGKPFKHYNEAGLLTFERYDFKGNVLEKIRQVISDQMILQVFPVPENPAPDWQIQAFRVNWQPPAGTTLEAHAATLLDPTAYRTSATYDALNRVALMRYPQDVEGGRKELRPQYNRAGALERVLLDNDTYVERIAYNAKGQRTLTALGNGVMTRYAYDPQTFRLRRLRTERYTKPDPNALTYERAGAPLQEFGYDYDLPGNITQIRDRTPESGVPNTLLGTDALDRGFSYDPLYRLISATGRECDRPPEGPPWDDQPRCTDITRTRGYTEEYQYDAVGNTTRLHHQIVDTGGFTREFSLVPGSNRLARMTIGETDYDYAFDANGNLIQETSSRHFEWDHSDQMRVFRTQVNDTEPSVHAHYLYDSGGQRVKKLVRKQGGQVEVTVYVDGVFEHHRLVQGATVQENNTLHVMDDESRIATVRVGVAFPDDTTLAIKYHVGDHLGSSNVAVDDSGTFVNREEYTPYGESSFGGFSKKRYRYTGKERDEENRLYYHGARYYAPWLGRWASCDPAGTADGINSYRYVKGNPLRLIDPTGTQTKDWHPTWRKTEKGVWVTDDPIIVEADPSARREATKPPKRQSAHEHSFLKTAGHFFENLAAVVTEHTAESIKEAIKETNEYNRGLLNLAKANNQIVPTGKPPPKIPLWKKVLGNKWVVRGVQAWHVYSAQEEFRKGHYVRGTWTLAHLHPWVSAADLAYTVGYTTGRATDVTLGWINPLRLGEVFDKDFSSGITSSKDDYAPSDYLASGIESLQLRIFPNLWILPEEHEHVNVKRGRPLEAPSLPSFPKLPNTEYGGTITPQGVYISPVRVLDE